MAHDPLASDKRVLIIGVVSVVVFAAIGVTGAALFTDSACTGIQPEPSVRPSSVGSPDQVLGELLDHDQREVRDELLAGVAELEASLGPATGAAEVTGADRLLGLADGRAVAVGASTRVIAAAGAAVEATAGFSPPAVVVGGGDGLFSLAWINDLTGQVDALTPLDTDLDAGTCLDTAVVGEPFAFHLDAGGGDLLLFRVEEDSAAPEIERRDADGRAWSMPLAVPTAPPGILAERVSARLGPQVVVARRVIPGETPPAVTAFDRVSGAVAWEVPADEVLAIGGRAEPLWVEVLAVGDELAVLGLSRDVDDDRALAAVVAIDIAEGAVRWDVALDAPARLEDVAIGPEVVAVALGDDTGTEVRSLGIEDGAMILTFDALPGDDARFAARTDGSAVLVTGDATAILSADGRELRPTTMPGRSRDVVVHQEATTLLHELPGGAAVTITFGG